MSRGEWLDEASVGFRGSEVVARKDIENRKDIRVFADKRRVNT